MPRLLRYYIGGVIEIYYKTTKGGGLPDLLQYYMGGSPNLLITLQYYIRPHQYITTLQRVVFKDNCNITDFEGKWKIIMGGGVSRDPQFVLRNKWTAPYFRSGDTGSFRSER